MSETVRVSWAAIMEQLVDPRMQHADWSAHCGCTHYADGRMVKCPGHAAGQQVVEAVRQ